MAYKSRFSKIPDQEFIQAVKECHFYRDILIRFGYSANAGTMYKVIRKRIKELGIDGSHLGTGKGSVKRRGGGVHCKHELTEILVEDSKYSNIYRLKKRIISANLMDYKCEVCGNNGEWNGRKLSLHLDHINGRNRDHRLENLRFLCPNCHSQTETFGSKNRTP